MVARLVAPEHDPAGEESSLPVDQNRIVGRTPSTRADNHLEFQWFRRFWTMKSGVENCRRQRPCSTGPEKGSEFISRDFDLWAYHNAVVLGLASLPFLSPGLASRRTTGWLRRPSGHRVVQREVPNGAPEHALVYEP